MVPIAHPIPPAYDESSEILILGSFPSVRSREMGYFYGHPQNRFWKVMAAVFGGSVPMTVPERRDFLLRNHIAVWDVIRTIYLNGKTAEKMYLKYTSDRISIPAICLPSTSPANAAWDLDRLIEAWRIIKE